MHPPVFIDAIRQIALHDSVFRFAVEHCEWRDGSFCPLQLTLIVPRPVVFQGIKGVCCELMRGRQMTRAEVVELVSPRAHG